MIKLLEKLVNSKTGRGIAAGLALTLATAVGSAEESIEGVENGFLFVNDPKTESNIETDFDKYSEAEQFRDSNWYKFQKAVEMHIEYCRKKFEMIYDEHELERVAYE